MQLSNPLESVLRHGPASALLALHRGGDRLTGRRVAIITGWAPSRTLDHLRSLVDIGLVKAERSPAATQYSVNREHLLWPAIQMVIEARDAFVSRLRDAAVSAPTGTAVALYGSVAAYRSTAESDVDLLVVYSDDVSLPERDGWSAHLAQLVRTWTGNPAEVFDLTRAQLAAMIRDGDPMIDSWRRDVEIVTGDLQALLHAAA